MATPQKVTEPAKAPAIETTHIEEPELPKYKVPNPRDRSEMVRVYDPKTGEKLPNRVPRNWLEKFPQLKEVPSSRNKAGK